jgi:hypothetical protein
MPGYDVSTERLRNAAKTYRAEAESWSLMLNLIKSWQLDTYDLGVLGQQAGVIGEYNQALINILGNLGKNQNALLDAAEDLVASANVYDVQEDQNVGDLHKLTPQK